MNKQWVIIMQDSFNNYYGSYTLYDMKIMTFTDLVAWQEGHKLVLLTYKATKLFPREELYLLTNQMRRAALSITSNIAEGFGRRTYKDKVHFYYQANGSLIELENHILVAKDTDYLDARTVDSLFFQCVLTHKLLQGLIGKSKTYIR